MLAKPECNARRMTPSRIASALRAILAAAFATALLSAPAALARAGGQTLQAHYGSIYLIALLPEFANDLRNIHDCKSYRVSAQRAVTDQSR